MVQPSATAPDLRPFFGDATAEELLDDVAEALHSMADLRGIAP
jgi:hypothetical protein